MLPGDLANLAAHIHRSLHPDIGVPMRPMTVPMTVPMTGLSSWKA
jgi:hypothetical protein